MRAALAILALCTLPAALSAEPKELFRSYYLGYEVIIYDDKSWAFADDAVDYRDASSLQDGYCPSTTDGRVQICDIPADWTPTDIISEDQSQTIQYEHSDGVVTMSISTDRGYGHEGDLDYYADLVNGNPLGTGLFAFAVDKILGDILPEERAFIFDDVVAVENFGEIDETYVYYDIEFLTETESVYLLISSLDDAETEFDPAIIQAQIADLAQRMTIDGVSYADLVAEKSQDGN